MICTEKLKEDTETFRNMNQEKYDNNVPDVGVEQKKLVNVEDA